jgi:single-stranded-DNA-specific exonuclease
MKWILNEQNTEIINELSENLKISNIIATILSNRGIKTVQEGTSFLNTKFPDMLYNPFLLHDMELAVDRIRTALEKKEKILIYGDRDVDGIAATTVLYYTIKSLGLTPICHVPSRDSNAHANRTRQGYGLQKEILEKYVKETGINLLITVDCGITSIDEIQFAVNNNVDVIIVDHHEPMVIDNKETLPAGTAAIINPKLKTSKYPMTDISGCTVAYKLSQALMMSYDKYYNKELVVMDIETTGLDARYDEIIEISALRIKNFVVHETLHTLVKPKKPISDFITGINGITNEMCSKAPDIGSALSDMSKFIGDRPIVAHNASFDMNFINTYLWQNNLHVMRNEIIDTLIMARELFPNQLHNLPTLSKNLNLTHQQPHHAIDDTYATLELFEQIEKKRNTRINFFLQDHLDIVTLSVISDMIPLIKENRVIVKHGLEQLTKTRKIGLSILLEYLLNYASNPLSLKTVSFNVIPVLNSCGRLDQANFAFDLLTVTDMKPARDILERIVFLNEERKNLQTIAIDRFKTLITKQCDIKTDKILVISETATDNDIPEGLLGIIATRFANIYNKPVIVIMNGIGACRSINNFSILNVLNQCSELLIRFGGHNQAAGFTIEPVKINQLRNKIKQISETQIDPASIEQTIIIDAVINAVDITPALFDELHKLEPFGQGNQPPVFLIKTVKISQTDVLKDKILFKIEQETGSIQATCMDKFYDSIEPEKPYDALIQINISKLIKKQPEISLIGLRQSS